MSRPPCNFHSRPGGCRNGSSCRFAHSDTGGSYQPQFASAVSSAGSSNLPTAPRSVCKWYWSKGSCTRGSSCHFQHQAAPGVAVVGSGSRSPVPTGSGTGSPSASRPSTPVAAQTPAPRGACKFFWTTGKCQHEFDCRYAHQVPSTPGTASQGSWRAPKSLPPAAMVLARGVGSDFVNGVQREVTPPEVQTRLIKLLAQLKSIFSSVPTYTFQSSTQIYSFLTLLSSAVSSNKSWTSEDGQLLLDKIASDDQICLDLIRDILVFNDRAGKEVSTNAGTALSKLSFQRGYMKLFAYFSSDFVVKSALDHRVNALYAVLHHNFAVVSKTVRSCMESMMARNSFVDLTQPRDEYSGTTIFNNLIMTLLEYLTRYKQAVSETPDVAGLVRDVAVWTHDWIERISRDPPTFADTITRLPGDVLSAFIRDLERKVEQTVQIVNREQHRNERPLVAPLPRHVIPNKGVLAALQAQYVGPGEDRPEGPRHDNDFVDIAKIRIAPTHGELVSKTAPFLPANLPQAPHPFPAESMERLLDIQFRLLREELTAPLRLAVQTVLDDLANVRRDQTQLGKILQNEGGRYRTDSVMFSVYTNATFVDLKAGRRGLSAELELDAPPGGARASSGAERDQFWATSGGKRLMQGGLVALIWSTSSGTSIHLGLISSSLANIAKSGHASNGLRITAGVTFFDSATDMRLLEELHSGYGAGDLKLIVEAPVMFESIRPFLEALRKEPATVPFAQYLVHRVDGRIPPVEPPSYAREPGFAFDLSSLLNSTSEHLDADKLQLSVTDPASVQAVRTRLREDSFLDPSQSDALVDSLVREIAMTQGPPGTGKSFIGVQLLRVLLQSKVRPILLIAFTNHALDHLLEAILDADIPSSIVRLGSKDRATERLKEYSLEELESSQDDESRLDKAKRTAYSDVRDAQWEIEKAVRRISQREVSEDELNSHLSSAWPDHHFSIYSPPTWTNVLFEASVDEARDWRIVGNNSPSLTSLLSFWVSGGDLDYLLAASKPHATHVHHPEQQHQAPNRFAALAAPDDVDLQSTGTSDDDEALPLLDTDDSSGAGLEEGWMHVRSQPVHAKSADGLPPAPFVSLADEHTIKRPPPVSPSSLLGDPRGFFEYLDIPIPRIPTSNRDMDELRKLDGGLWLLSRSERQELADFWKHEARESYHQSSVQEFESLRKELAESQRRYNALVDQSRIRLLENMDIIGCTTNGAAKLASLMKALAPQVVMVEEAGQVLEAHVLGSLVPSVQHLICIGDPLQLRPTLSNYSLSVDSRRGAELYRFDMSTMERLSQHGMPMSRLNVQRRMRPSIADLIRVPFLYPDLQDHACVSNYPDVKGVPKSIFFMAHEHKEEGGGEDSVSKHNSFEVAMIVDIVSYLIRQLPRYAEPGSIVVLCAYLGQLVRLRDAFSRLFTVVIDERDQSLLEDRVGDEQAPEQDCAQVERVKMSQRILLRTVDNFQGEEADIILLSLVRNSGELASNSTIGFLKSLNRTNVALSRARHGLYILGNSANLASHSPLWASVIDKLYETDSVGPEFPFTCPRHPAVGIRYATRPGEIPQMAPDGGCLHQCQERLSCGHSCPLKCHPDSHAAVICAKPCQRMCTRQHPCDRRCAETCGDCRFPFLQVQLSCGHFEQRVSCFQMDNLDDITCRVLVEKQLQNCSHSATMPCFADAAKWKCQEPCGMLNPACAHPCKGRCHECQVPGRLDERKHVPHRCGRGLFCRHPCEAPCGESSEHVCTTECKHTCRQVCTHFSCKKPCCEPCEPCKEPCSWQCPHFSCPVPCGSPCARLPCDEPCGKELECGHPCPSLCGEICSSQICPRCTSSEESDIVDYVLQRTLHEVDPALGTLDELLITLACRHVFTVETLDGHCQLAQYYQQDSGTGRWLGLAIPDAGYKEPLTCPKCRAPVTSPRYGRASKRADLDVLERNVAGRMFRLVDSLDRSVSAVDASALRKNVDDAILKLQRTGYKDVPLGVKARRTLRAKQAQLRRLDTTPISADVFGTRESSIFPFSKAEWQAWSNLCSPLVRLYSQASSIVATRFAHVAAYEAAFTTLYRAELESCLQRLAQAPTNPEQYALTEARVQIGQPRPRADTRFIIEAMWKSIEIRLMLASLARDWLKGIPVEHANRAELWAGFSSFIYASVVNDAERALSAAAAAEAHRQVLRSHLLVMRAKFEEFNFNLFMWQRQGMDAGSRQKLLTRTRERRQEAAKYQAAAIAAYRVTRRRTTYDEEWIADTFGNASAAILAAWATAENILRSGVFYQPVTLEDKMTVVKALGFSHVGHFYCCPNGHTYVIADCGGATNTARCPECDAPIGGRNHTLNSSNTRDEEMESLARQRGAQRSPWAWGQ